MTDRCARRPDVFGIVVKHAKKALCVLLDRSRGVVSHQPLDRRSASSRSIRPTMVSSSEMVISPSLVLVLSQPLDVSYGLRYSVMAHAPAERTAVQRDTG